VLVKVGTWWFERWRFDACEVGWLDTYKRTEIEDRFGKNCL